MYRKANISQVVKLVEKANATLKYHHGEWTKCSCKKMETFNQQYLICYVTIRECDVQHCDRVLYRCNSRFLKAKNEDVWKLVNGLQSFIHKRRCFKCVSNLIEDTDFLNFTLANYEILENASLKIPCLGAGNGDDVDWFKDDKIHLSNLNDGQRKKQHHYEVTPSGVLLIRDAVTEDTGEFKCFVNGHPSLKVRLDVTPIDIMQTKEFQDLVILVLKALLVASLISSLGTLYFFCTA